jgi:hypothetical protein
MSTTASNGSGRTDDNRDDVDDDLDMDLDDDVERRSEGLPSATGGILESPV